MATYVVVSSLAARIVRRAGFKTTIAAGLLLSATGALLTVTQQPRTTFAVTALLLAMLGVGSGLILPPTTAAAVVSVPHRDGGMASATVNMFRQVGNTLGASITRTLITHGLASRLPAELVQHVVAPVLAAHVARAVSNGSSAPHPPPGLSAPILASRAAEPLLTP